MTWALSHLRAFVANQVLSRIRAFLGLFCPDFYSDIRDFTQILCRYLPKKLATGASAMQYAFASMLFPAFLSRSETVDIDEFLLAMARLTIAILGFGKH